MCVRVSRDSFITEATTKLQFCGIFYKVGLKGSAIGVVLMFLLFIVISSRGVGGGRFCPETKAYSVVISLHMSIHSNIIEMS